MQKRREQLSISGLVSSFQFPVNSKWSLVTGHWPLATFLFLLFSLVSCDLFNKPADPDYLQGIRDEIAWANAPKLIVQLDYRQEWGGSNPIRGQISTGEVGSLPIDIRQGYGFSVEFTPLSGFYFAEWLAFYTSEYDWAWLADYETAKSYALPESIVDIQRGDNTQTGAITATVTILVNSRITLVPFCGDRPQITNSRPPLVNDGSFFIRGQQITIWVDLGNEDSALAFGENEIQITAHDINDGKPYNETGDITMFFDEPFYSASDKTIRIIPKVQRDNTEEAPPGYHLITVTVGTGIKASNGEGMAAAVSFSYRTSYDTVTRAYKANNVWAIHDSNDSRPESFFYQLAPSDRDRRLRINNEGNYEVSLYFSVSRSIGEIIDPMPNKLKIAQVFHADLTGKEIRMEDYNDFKDYENDNVKVIYDNYIEPNNEGITSAGGVYRYMDTYTNPLGVFYYKAVYTFEKEFDNDDKEIDSSGIYRIVILPYREGVIESDTWQTAVDENRFVTVVIDNDAPGGNPRLNISGHTYIHDIDGITVNAFIEADPFLVINPDFSLVFDNNEKGGILPVRSNPNLPWTMDEQRNLQWQWSIISNNDDELLHLHLSEWFQFGASPPAFDVSEILELADYENDRGDEGKEKGPVNPQIGEISVRFRDSLGNLQSDWSSINKIIYTEEPDAIPVTNWSATYNEALDTIVIRWTTPTIMTGGVRVRINDNIETGTIDYTASGTGQRSYTIRNVKRRYTPMNESEPVVDNYRIQLIAIKDGSLGDNVAGNFVSLPQPIFITNIPEMVSTENNPVIAIKDAADLAAIRDLSKPYYYGIGTENSHKVFVLADNITVSSHIPIGTGTNATNAFNAKFYGNGNTVTINSFDGTADTDANGYPATNINEAQIGLFGTTSGNALIRELTVNYNNINIICAAGDTNVGCVTGSLRSNARIENVVVEGNFTVNKTNNSILRVGGITGYITDTSVEINGSLITANIFCNKTNNGDVYLGGTVGAIVAGGKLTNIKSSSKITISKSINNGAGAASGSNYIGGIAGRITATSITGSAFSGKIQTGEHYRVTSNYSYIGGFAGYVAASTAATTISGTMSGDIDMVFTGTNPHGAIAGGIAGEVAASANLTIENCFVRKNAGATAADRNNISITSNGTMFLGGIVGNLYSSDIKNSAIHSNITANTHSNQGYNPPTSSYDPVWRIGGAVGYSRFGGTLTNITSSALIKFGKKRPTSTAIPGQNRIGGIIGDIEGATNIASSAFSGKIETLDVKTTNWNHIGGLVGYVNHTANITISGNVTGDIEITLDAGGSGINAGGIAGEIAGTGATTITGSTVSNNISVTSNYEIRLGGIAGNLQSASPTVENSTANSTLTLTANSGVAIFYGGAIGRSLSTQTVRNTHSTSEFSITKQSGTNELGGTNYWGGFAGYVDGTTFEECSYTGNITLGSTFKASGHAHVGGFVGNVQSGTITDCNASGAITDQSSSTGAKCIGGFIGSLGTGNANATPVIEDSYSSVPITINSPSINQIGGFIGLQNGNAEITDCYSTGNVTVTTGTLVQAGGFAGRMSNNTNLKLTKVHATGNVTVNNSTHSNNAVAETNWAGGLVGLIFLNSGSTRSEIKQSYATGTVYFINNSSEGSSTSNNGFHAGAGGLVGRAQGANISECYATGNVTFLRNGTADNQPDIGVGGLVGRLDSTASISDSYALGNITANSNNTAERECYLLVGGIVGQSFGNVTQSFAAGDITSQINKNQYNYAGGIVGYMNQGTVSNTVALGFNKDNTTRKITAQSQNASSSGAVAFRIAGRRASGTLTNNFANSAILLGTANTYTGPVTTAPVPTGTGTSTGTNGVEVSTAQLGTQTFWTAASPNGPGFSAEVWDFTGIGTRGYPLLRNAGGQ